MRAGAAWRQLNTGISEVLNAMGFSRTHPSKRPDTRITRPITDRRVLGVGHADWVLGDEERSRRSSVTAWEPPKRNSRLRAPTACRWGQGGWEVKKARWPATLPPCPQQQQGENKVR